MRCLQASFRFADQDANKDANKDAYKYVQEEQSGVEAEKEQKPKKWQA